MNGLWSILGLLALFVLVGLLLRWVERRWNEKDGEWR